MTRFLVWCPYYGQSEDDARTVDAADARAAVEQWARWHDGWSADYSIVGGHAVTVYVLRGHGTHDSLAEREARAASSGELRRFNVVGEPVPSYTACETRLGDLK
jgi:hypothetical protein